MAESLSSRSLRHRILKAMLDKTEGIQPQVSHEMGIGFPHLEKAVNVKSEELYRILEELCMEGLLAFDVVDSVALCPKCGSHRLMLHIYCPLCNSPKLEKAAMIEHLSCGHMDVEGFFRKGETLVCPKCGKTLKAIGVDYRRVGKAYKCLGCNGNFPTPGKRYVCAVGHTFNEDEAVLRQVKSYKLNSAKRAAVERETLEFNTLLQGFEEKGWAFRTPAQLRGKSGVQHEFAFALWTADADPSRDSPDILADAIVSDGVVDSNAVFSSLSKMLDVKPGEAVLLAMPKVDDKGRVLANSYNLHLVEGETAEKLKADLKPLLEDLTRGREGDAFKMEAEALAEALRELGAPFEEEHKTSAVGESVKRDLAELDRLFMENKISLDEYIKRRKTLINSFERNEA